ncbi:Cyclin mcs2 [Psilocybe cubensis]|uniref:Cyclin mcs2 n=2 Tax=Psilocybe cubensis TaxID=181762 RepID=A0ACB8HGJ0_PSICU|nr:Cyclin mcs2 [Psilocybe cubensis]KAH9486787.1 Cyclin mcs2 [Psilocybe cubensis]
MPSIPSNGNTGKLSSYEASTQARNWRYSVDQLTRIRTSLNQAAVGVIRNTFESDEPGSSSNVSFLIADEEVLLVKLYITKITQLCGLFRFPEEVEATAITYLKRFYLKNTVMDWHPKNVMRVLTALFLATKTTNNPISLETYTAHIPKTSPNDVLDLEFLVAQSLGFEFAVWHAHRALWGIWLDIQNLPSVTEKLQPELYDTALGHIRASRLTDAELIYTPSQIALAAFSLTLPDITSEWIASKTPSDSWRLTKSINEIKEMITSQGHPPNIESVREVDRRLKICKNPEKVVGSKAYLARKRDEERIAEEKRNKKVAELQKELDESDPFGTELGDKRRALAGGLVDYDDDDDDD